MRDKRRTYDIEWELGRSRASMSVTRNTGVTLFGMDVPAWEALIKEGMDAQAAFKQADTQAGGAAVKVGRYLDDLAKMCNSIRRVAIGRFKKTRPDLAQQFEAVMTEGDTPQAILGRGMGIKAAWSNAPEPDTFEPLRDLRLTDFVAHLTEAETLYQDSVDKDRDKSQAAGKLQVVAEKIHDTNVQWYTEAQANFSYGSPERRELEAVPVTSDDKPKPANPQPAPAVNAPSPPQPGK